MDFLFGPYQQDILLTLHLMAFAAGAGAATTMDIVFARYLLSVESENWQPKLYETCTVIIWVALGLISLSGLGLFLPKATELLSSSKFLLKMLVIGVIMFNGFRFNKVLSPKLNKIFCQESLSSSLTLKRNLRRRAFISGAISMTSWYAAIILGSLPALEVSFFILLSYYLLALLGASCASLLAEHLFSRSIHKRSSSVAKEVADELLHDINVFHTLISRPRKK